MKLEIYQRKGSVKGVEDVLLDSIPVQHPIVPREGEFIQIGRREMRVTRVVHELYEGVVKVFVL